MGISVLDALNNEINPICPGSSRSSNLIDSVGDTPVALLTGKQQQERVGSSDMLGLSQWCHMLDWRPDFNLFAPVFDDLSQLGEEKRGNGRFI